MDIQENETRALQKRAAKNITPPTVGTERWCILRASLGSSTRCFLLASMIKEGMPNSATRKASVAGSIKDIMALQM